MNNKIRSANGLWLKVFEASVESCLMYDCQVTVWYKWNIKKVG